MSKTPRITLVPHTHWDREWYEPFEVFRAHLIEMLDLALDALEADPHLHFTLDGHVALVDDYLELRPAAEPRIRALVEAGRLHLGPWFTQADTLLADGESLIRNLILGMRRAAALGGAMRLGYMPDQFGHAAQIPQILRLFDIDSAVLWRGVGPERPPHAFRWRAPDGSEVTALWLQDGYASGRRLPSDPKGFADAVEKHIARLGSWLGEMPVLVPVGDDHVKLATWLPEAARELRTRRPDATITVGGYQHHLPHVGTLTHTVAGELRSPTFAPVLAGVASARVREKQTGADAALLLQRYAEPLLAWLGWADPGHRIAARPLVERAWRLLLLNHAHDSVAGCGADAAHEDVRARYRWVEQLARAACDQALARLHVDGAALAFHAGPAAPTATFEAQVPRSLGSEVEAIGQDGVARAVQLLDEVEERPLFEGEFAAAELNQYLGSLDPNTPLFGRYLQGITVSDEGGGLMRLDVGLGDRPPPREKLAQDQERVAGLLKGGERFKVVLHGSAATRPALVQVGPAPEAGFVSTTFRRGKGDANAPGVIVTGSTLEHGTLRVEVKPDGSVHVTDSALGLPPVVANLLVDEGDRGDLYHADPVGEEVRPGDLTVSVIERGPVRGRLRIGMDLELPVGLDLSRRARSTTRHRITVVTEVSLTAGERRVAFTTRLDNPACDHRLRTHLRIPLSPERLDVEHGLTVVPRPLDPTRALGSGVERAAPTGQHHGFVDVSDGRVGVALVSPGLYEHEAVTAEPGVTSLALTLLRSVGWLSRGDLSVIDHAAGPMMPTPGAQELGPHRFTWALYLHPGDWQRGGVAAEARRFAAPAWPVVTRGRTQVPAGRAMVELEPGPLLLSALHPDEDHGLIVRLVNFSAERSEGRLRPVAPIASVEAIDPLGQPSSRVRVSHEGEIVRVALDAWQIATFRLRWKGA